MASSSSDNRRRRSSEIRLADIAERAGVSTATVSRALNQPDKVSSALRQRVMKTVEELHWVPHAAAKALASQRTKTIGVIMAGSLGHENLARELEAMQRQLAMAGYSLLLAFSELETGRELDQTRVMLERGVDALVLHGESHDRRLWKLLQARQTPVVFTRTATDIDGFTTVGYDMFGAFRSVTEHLLKLGHERFGMMMITTPEREAGKSRKPDPRVQPAYDAVLETLNENGLSVRPNHMTNTYFGLDRGRECLRQIMQETPYPTALICMNDYMAIGAMLECQAMGLRVPEDISITGFDDIEWGANIEPSLTTVRAPDAEMGRVTADYVLGVLDDETAPARRHELDFELLIRESTGPAPA